MPLWNSSKKELKTEVEPKTTRLLTDGDIRKQYEFKEVLGT